MAADAPSGRVFGYGISRASWMMLGGLILAVAVFAAESLLVGGLSAWSEEQAMGLALLALVLGCVLLPVPVLEILWWLRGRVVVGPDGLHWRDWSGWHSLEWAQIIAVGCPTAAAHRSDDTRLHVVTDGDYEFICGYRLRELDEAIELMVTWAGLPELAQVGPHLFHCRAGRSEEVVERAAEHLDTGGYDPWDFWAGRAARF